MGKVLYSVTMSLDGFIAGPGGDMSWLTPYLGPNPEVEELQREIGALLIGHRTFRGDDPNRGTDKEGAFSGTWSGPSVVVTHDPPETPVPTKCRPCALRADSRRRVSTKCALPQSITMSSSSSSGTSSSITSSVASPALTMMITARGRSSDATKSSSESDGTNFPSSPCCSTSEWVRAEVLLCTATVCPWWARLRARLRPITARPVTPMFALACAVMTPTLATVSS